jgi:ribosome-interacting GTPase 1
LDEVDRLAHAPDTVMISCHSALNLDLLLDKIWEYLNFIRIYTKPRGKRPDFSDVRTKKKHHTRACCTLLQLLPLKPNSVLTVAVHGCMFHVFLFLSSYSQPLIMRNGSSIEHVCHSIHREMVKNFKYALVWGSSAKHQPQRVGIMHYCEDEDVVQIMTK